MALTLALKLQQLGFENNIYMCAVSRYHGWIFLEINLSTYIVNQLLLIALHSTYITNTNNNTINKKKTQFWILITLLHFI